MQETNEHASMLLTKMHEYIEVSLSRRGDDSSRINMSSEIASTMALRQYHTRLDFRHHKRLAYHHLTAHAHELESRVAYEVFHPGGGGAHQSQVLPSRVVSS